MQGEQTRSHKCYLSSLKMKGIIHFKRLPANVPLFCRLIVGETLHVPNWDL